MDSIKRFMKALAAAEEVIRNNPSDHNAYNNRGVVLTKLGRLEEAIESFRYAIRCKPNFARAYHNMGLALRALGRLPDAINAFDRAVELKPNIPIIFDKRAAALIDLGASLNPRYTRCLFEAALADAERAIELSSDAEGHYNMACALSRLGRFEEALDQLAKTKGVKGADFDSAHAWEDHDYDPLREEPWIDRFTEIVGPRPAARHPESW